MAANGAKSAERGRGLGADDRGENTFRHHKRRRALVLAIQRQFVWKKISVITVRRLPKGKGSGGREGLDGPPVRQAESGRWLREGVYLKKSRCARAGTIKYQSQYSILKDSSFGGEEFQ